MTKVLESQLDRRGFLRRGVVGAAGLAAASIAACAPITGARWTYDPRSSLPAGAGSSLPPTASAVATAAATATPGISMNHGTPQASMATDDMDALAEAVIKRFPETTAVVGNQPLVPRMDGATKVFELTASVIKWQIARSSTQSTRLATTACGRARSSA